MKMKDFSWDSKGHRDLEKMIDELFVKPPSSNSLTKSPKRRWYHFVALKIEGLTKMSMRKLFEINNLK